MYEILPKSRKSPHPFKVVELKLADFHGWKTWCKDRFTVLGRVDENNDRIMFSNIRSWRVDSKKSREMSFKYSFHDLEPWKRIFIDKNRLRPAESALDSSPVQMRTNQRPVKQGKVNDLPFLKLFLLKAKSKEFYDTLIGGGVDPPSSTNKAPGCTDEPFLLKLDKFGDDSFQNSIANYVGVLGNLTRIFGPRKPNAVCAPEEISFWKKVELRASRSRQRAARTQIVDKERPAKKQKTSHKRESARLRNVPGPAFPSLRQAGIELEHNRRRG